MPTCRPEITGKKLSATPVKARRRPGKPIATLKAVAPSTDSDSDERQSGVQVAPPPKPRSVTPAAIEPGRPANEAADPGRRPQSARGPPRRRPHLHRPGEDLLSIEEFCRRHAISLAFYYVLRARGLGPDETRLGSRVLISRESAATWRAARQADTEAASS
jgi:hypothetical protein